VVDTGHCDIFVEGIGQVSSWRVSHEIDAAQIGLIYCLQVAESNPGGSFGELALMYDAPRAASVVSLPCRVARLLCPHKLSALQIATVPTVLWALDQDTFKKTIMSSTIKQRARHEKFLESVAILGALLPYERMTVADALKERAFPAGSNILEEGTFGTEFYIIETGEVRCTKRNVASEVSPRLCAGSYFGERALLTQEARAATVTAVTDVVCQMLDRETFQRLLGPLEDTFRRNMQVYAQYKDIVPSGHSDSKYAAEGKGQDSD